MGEFLVRLEDKESGIILHEEVAKNVFALEGAHVVYHALFPPYPDFGASFLMGICGATDESRPNPGGGLSFDPELTFADCTTEATANESGGYQTEMHNSFGYSRQVPVFVASRRGGGGEILCQEIEFQNDHVWTPQDSIDWDDPNTSDIEQPPPKWFKRHPNEPDIGYPWHRPRKLCSEFGFPTIVRSYMYTWQTDDSLDYLCDFRRMSSFPVSLAFISAGSQLLAAAKFASDIHMRPGLSLFVRYRARIAGNVTEDFAYRMARKAYQKTGARYDTIWCRPLVGTKIPTPFYGSKYNDYLPYLHAGFAAIEVDTFSDSAAADPAYVWSTNNALEWTNSTGASMDFPYILVYGLVSGVPELIWPQEIDPIATVPDGDVLRIPAGMKFQFLDQG